MTLEEMIDSLELHSKYYDCPLSYAEGQSIIAALRRLERLEKAGQQLANKAEAAERMFGQAHLEAHGIEAVPPELVGVCKARRAWDAATKGDDK